MNVCHHQHRTVAAMCMPALRALARAAVAISVAEEIATRSERRTR